MRRLPNAKFSAQTHTLPSWRICVLLFTSIATTFLLPPNVLLAQKVVVQEDMCNSGNTTLVVARVTNAGLRADNWYSEGWFRLEPTQCGSMTREETALFSGFPDAWGFHGYYYFAFFITGRNGTGFVKYKTGRWSNSGINSVDRRFCVDLNAGERGSDETYGHPSRGFERVSRAEDLDNCPDGWVLAPFSIRVDGYPGYPARDMIFELNLKADSLAEVELLTSMKPPGKETVARPRPSPARPRTRTAGPEKTLHELTFRSVSVAGHSCGLTEAGAAFCWGWNRNAQLGDGTRTHRSVPVAVRGGLNFRSVSAGFEYSCGLTEAGAAYCWGDNEGGQLGDATNTDRSVPVAVRGGLTFRSVSAGFNNSCGLTEAGAAYCWGLNARGQLGDGTTTSSRVPVAVRGGLTFRSVSAGFEYSCGVTTEGAAYCWGRNQAGRLGDGTRTHRSVPVAVRGGLTFRSVSTGSANSCALTEAGAAYCWGLNDRGQLGDGTTTSSRVPVAVRGGLTFRSVSAGSANSCALTEAGAAYCWGANENGRLGDGTTTDRSVPVLIHSVFSP